MKLTCATAQRLLDQYEVERVHLMGQIKAVNCRHGRADYQNKLRQIDYKQERLDDAINMVNAGEAPDILFALMIWE